MMCSTASCDRAREHLAALGELSDAQVADVDAAATLQAQLVKLSNHWRRCVT